MGEGSITIHAVVRPADDAAGGYVAYCRDFDVFSQGDSEEHAFAMLAEAVGMVWLIDHDDDRNPYERGVRGAYPWREKHPHEVEAALKIPLDPIRARLDGRTP